MITENHIELIAAGEPRDFAFWKKDTTQMSKDETMGATGKMRTWKRSTGDIFN